MIVVKIEMWPGGNQENRYLLGSAILINDSSGSATWGDYECTLFLKGKRIWKQTYVAQFPRQRLNAWHLVKRMLENTL